MSHACRQPVDHRPPPRFPTPHLVAAVQSEVNKMERMSLALLDPDLQFDESAAILRRTRLASNASRRTSYGWLFCCWLLVADCCLLMYPV